MLKFKDSDYVVGPRRDASDAQQADDARDQTQRIKDSWNGKHTKADLSLHHQRNCTQPTNLGRFSPTLSYCPPNMGFMMLTLR